MLSRRGCRSARESRSSAAGRRLRRRGPGGAPDAVHSAERWHIWRILDDVVERTVVRLRPPDCRTVVTPQPESQEQPDAIERRNEIHCGPVVPEQGQDRTAVRTRQGWNEVHTLSAQGQAARLTAASSGSLAATPAVSLVLLVMREQPAPDGPVLMTSDGYFRVPFRQRRRVGLSIGDRVLLTGRRSRARLLLLPPAALSTLLAAHLALLDW